MVEHCSVPKSRIATLAQPAPTTPSSCELAGPGLTKIGQVIGLDRRTFRAWFAQEPLIKAALFQRRKRWYANRAKLTAAAAAIEAQCRENAA
jgi:hypothetical protein